MFLGIFHLLDSDSVDTDRKHRTGDTGITTKVPSWNQTLHIAVTVYDVYPNHHATQLQLNKLGT